MIYYTKCLMKYLHQIHNRTECEKQPDFTAVLTTTAISNHLIQIHQTFADEQHHY